MLICSQGWNGMGIAEPILKVMAEKGFKEPTEIQALTFPAAILGRRDILGAAETGLFRCNFCFQRIDSYYFFFNFRKWQNIGIWYSNHKWYFTNETKSK